MPRTTRSVRAPSRCTTRACRPPGPFQTLDPADLRREVETNLLGVLLTARRSLGTRFGLQRHMGVMTPNDVARAVVLAVTTPPGVFVGTIEVQPTAPATPG
jgi:NAD(P)-dependent dehydrogenase (short-subunit alcohol dehydrogenase family)